VTILLSSRLYDSVDDLEAVLGLIRQARPAAQLADYPGVVDLREMLSTPSYQAQTYLWHDAGGRLRAYAIFDAPNLSFEVLSGEERGEIEEHILRWVEQLACRPEHLAGETPTLETSCQDHQIERIALLERVGFVREPDCGLHYIRPLDLPIATPELPPGFTIRSIEEEHEADAWVMLHRAAWGTEWMTVEYRHSMTRVPHYDPALDLVAVAPDGTLAAYCFCYISPEENALTGRNDGYTDPMVTHPDYQRRGLSRALLLEGLRRLKDRGVENARTGTGSENIAMQRTAESVGFRLTGRTLWYTKTLGES
jgi:GNAT superfamily N-acetyltransferase